MTLDAYEIDDDPARVDVAAAADFLTTQAYWARWRTRDDVERQIREARRVVGAYDGSGVMVGFARAFGDGGSAYLADVYVLPTHRGGGLGTAIVRAMVEDGPGPSWRWMLHTSDAHGLYRKFGFATPNAKYLERPRREEATTAATAAKRCAPPSAGATGPLVGKHVRLEPLDHHHVPGLLAAGAGGGDLYRWTSVPQDEAGMRRLVEFAMADRDRGRAVPFAVVRAEDDVVIGSTRFWDLAYWAWPQPRDTPDTCEIGHTWLAREAVRTAANTEMKRLMLTHAFDVWGVRSVWLHTDARNERSRAAIARIGGRFEGILHAHRLAADLTVRDSARFCIAADEWPSVRRHLEELANR